MRRNIPKKPVPQLPITEAEAKTISAFFRGPIFSTIATDSRVRTLLNSRSFTQKLSEVKMALQYCKESEQQNLMNNAMAQDEGISKLVRVLLGKVEVEVEKKKVFDTFKFRPDNIRNDNNNNFVDLAEANNGKNAVPEAPIPRGVQQNAFMTARALLENGGSVHDVANLFKGGDADFLLWMGDDLDYNLLHFAAKFDRGDIVKYLVREQKMDVNCQSRYGKTALHLASIEGKLNAANALLRAGASLETRDDKGMAALEYALNGGNAGLVETLLSNLPEEFNQEEEVINALSRSQETTVVLEKEPVVEAVVESVVVHTHKPVSTAEILLLQQIEELKMERNEFRSEARRLNNENMQLEDALFCCVCLDRTRNSVLFPCMHNVTCWDCSRSVKKKSGQCPICSQKIKQIKKVYQ